MKNNIEKLEEIYKKDCMKRGINMDEIDREIAEMERRINDIEMKVIEHQSRDISRLRRKADKLDIPASEIIECIRLWGWGITLQAIDIITTSKDLRIACLYFGKKELLRG